MFVKYLSNVRYFVHCFAIRSFVLPLDMRALDRSGFNSRTYSAKLMENNGFFLGDPRELEMQLSPPWIAIRLTLIFKRVRHYRKLRSHEDNGNGAVVDVRFRSSFEFNCDRAVSRIVKRFLKFIPALSSPESSQISAIILRVYKITDR